MKHFEVRSGQIWFDGLYVGDLKETLWPSLSDAVATAISNAGKSREFLRIEELEETVRDLEADKEYLQDELNQATERLAAFDFLSL